MVGDSKREWWSKNAPQVYARFAGGDPDSPPIRLPDGAADKPAPFDPEGRTYRQLTKAGLLLCPMKGCEPFSTPRQGVDLRSHFCHEKRPDDALHRGGPESVWHQQAKFAIHDWLAATFDPPASLTSNLSTRIYRLCVTAGDGTPLSTWNSKTVHGWRSNVNSRRWPVPTRRITARHGRRG
jgi:hypothetical protein